MQQSEGVEAIGLWIRPARENTADLQWAHPISEQPSVNHQDFMANVVKALGEAKKQSDQYLTGLIA